MAARKRTYTTEQRAKKRAYNADWYQANKEQVLARVAEWWEANPEKHRAACAKWAKEHPEKVRASKTKYCKNNPEKVRASKTKWAKENPAKDRASKAKYSKENPEKIAAAQARRKAAKLQATPAWANPDLIRDIYAEAHRQGMHVDHIVPLRNPRVCGLHWEGNLQLLTAEENKRKGNKLLAEHHLTISTAAYAPHPALALYGEPGAYKPSQTGDEPGPRPPIHGQRLNWGYGPGYPLGEPLSTSIVGSSPADFAVEGRLQRF